jgi:hypothetical protein
MKFKLGDLVKKVSGSGWHGTVVGTYSTELTPEGYAVESSTEKGSVQIYPAKALESWSDVGQMNERIKELLKQAAKLANTEHNKDFDRSFDMIVAEKFAQLIVQECVCLVLNGKYDDEQFDANNEFHCGHNIALDGTAEGITKHFGVEE